MARGRAQRACSGPGKARRLGRMRPAAAPDISLAFILSPLHQALLLDFVTRCMRDDARAPAVMQDLCTLLHVGLGYRLVWLAVADEAGGLAVTAAAGAAAETAGLVGVTLQARGRRGETQSHRCLRTGHRVTSRHAVAELPPPAQPGALAVLPLKSADRVDGVLGVLADPTHHTHHFARDELELLDRLASQAAFALRMLSRFGAADEAGAHQKLASAVFEYAMEGIFITDLDGRILAANPAACRITGYSEQELFGATPAILKSGRHDSAFYEAFWQALIEDGSWRGEIWNRRKSGEVYPELLCVSAIHSDEGRVVRYVALLVDISRQKAVEAQLERKANHDELTGLPNRGQFQGYLARVLARARREQGRLAVLFLDLDGFKYVNDTLGHSEGDVLIRTVADRLLHGLRSEDMVARLGGDEFAVVLPGISHLQDAATVARKLLELMSEPVALAHCEVHVTASVGIAVFPEDGDSVDLLLRRADNAMYNAKEMGCNTVQFYRPEMDARSGERFTIGSALKHALERDDLFLVYQPQIDVRCGRLVGVEALLRWRHQGEVISPARFIPIAEETGLIVAIGEWVLRTACAQGRAWLERGLHGLRMSVNLSARQFRERRLLGMIRAALDDSGFPAPQLDVEITETLAMGNAVATGHVLAALKDMGVGIAIDDFGTGYSSLAYLGQYPLDTLKIDLSFVQAIGRAPRVESIIRAVIAMARTLELKLIAEGAETAAQIDFLREAGCDVVQGYFLGEPMAAELFEARYCA